MYNIVESIAAQNFSNTEFLKLDLGINEWYVRTVWPSSLKVQLASPITRPVCIII